MQENKESLKSIEIDGKTITRETLEKMENAEERIKLAAKVLDTFGVEALLGLFTGVGDVGSLMLSLYPVVLAIQHGLPKKTIFKMSWNIGKDTMISLIPIVGDLIDFFYKANQKNSALFSEHVEKIRSHFSAAELAVAEERAKLHATLE